MASTIKKIAKKNREATFFGVDRPGTTIKAGRIAEDGNRAKRAVSPKAEVERSELLCFRFLFQISSRFRFRFRCLVQLSLDTTINGAFEYLKSFSDRFGSFSESFGSLSDRFGTFSDRFGCFRTAPDRFWTVSDRF